jgi:hypothetical protein
VLIAPALPLALIHPTAWKVTSRKSTSRTLNAPVLTGQNHHSEADLDLLPNQRLNALAVKRLPGWLLEDGGGFSCGG